MEAKDKESGVESSKRHERRSGGGGVRGMELPKFRGDFRSRIHKILNHPVQEIVSLMTKTMWREITEKERER